MRASLRENELAADRSSVLAAIVGFGRRRTFALQAAIHRFAAWFRAGEAVERSDQQDNAQQANEDVNTPLHFALGYQILDNDFTRRQAPAAASASLVVCVFSMRGLACSAELYAVRN